MRACRAVAERLLLQVQLLAHAMALGCPRVALRFAFASERHSGQHSHHDAHAPDPLDLLLPKHQGLHPAPNRRRLQVTCPRADMLYNTTPSPVCPDPVVSGQVPTVFKRKFEDL